ETATEIIETLTQLGVTVKVAGPDRLRIEPASRIPPELIPRIKEAKPDILRVLQGRPSSSLDCGASCYEVTHPETGKPAKIHRPWDGGCRARPEELTTRQVERECWHCAGAKKCRCVSCALVDESGPCAACGGSGKTVAWVH
ncbi:MAG TPA: hypothetical protein VKZ53_11445, partial [Candidatus Angelobacter sp.]|nr:hypothetical protein [Candidatus Angelobacter sp.]